MATFADIITRLNGQDIWASWFNQLRDAGITLENQSPQAEVQIADVENNQMTPFGTGIILDSSDYHGYVVRFNGFRKTDDFHNSGVIMLYINFKVGTGWRVEREQKIEPLGITFSVDAGTQEIMMVTDDLTGANYSGKGTIKIIDRAEVAA